MYDKILILQNFLEIFFENLHEWLFEADLGRTAWAKTDVFCKFAGIAYLDYKADTHGY